jgi:thiosulfate dehydrogenase [quinone] large subunit
LNRESTLAANTGDPNFQSAYFLLRATLGLNICLHGVSRILAGTSHFASSLVPGFEKTFLPTAFVYSFGLALPWFEGAFGLLLLLGLATRLSLIAGSLLIFVLTFGTALKQDWPTASLQLIYAALYAALLAFHHYNRYSVDSLLPRQSKL